MICEGHASIDHRTLGLETVGGAFMRNERGNIIALVLLILAVVSLVGAGALMMSRYDLRFTAAMRSYDQGFNLADGGATLGFRYVGTADPEKYFLSSDDGSAVTGEYKDTPPNAHVISCHCLDESCCQRRLSDPIPYQCQKEAGKTKYTCTRCVDRTAGEYDGSIQFIDYTTDIKTGSQYDVDPGVSLQYWSATGVSERAGVGQTFKTGNSTVQMSALKPMLKK
jgi:hypothetical protein